MGEIGHFSQWGLFGSVSKEKGGDLFIEDLKLYGFIRYTTKHYTVHVPQ